MEQSNNPRQLCQRVPFVHSFVKENLSRSSLPWCDSCRVFRCKGVAVRFLSQRTTGMIRKGFWRLRQGLSRAPELALTQPPWNTAKDIKRCTYSLRRDFMAVRTFAQILLLSVCRRTAENV